MASRDRDDEPDPRALLGDVLDDPEAGREKLPYVVGLFESDERSSRLYAAWTCCVLANELDDGDAIEYLVRRLSDRLDGEHASLELTTALDYISTRHSEQVERILEEMEAEEREAGELPLPRVGNFTRSHYYSNEASRDGVGRTRVAGSDGPESPRRAYADREQEEREQIEHERDRDDTAEGTDTGQPPEQPDSDGRMADEGSPGDEAAMAQQRTEISSIATRSQFDKLHILASRRRNRYADEYDALVARRGEEKAVALRLLRTPDPAGRPDFEARVKPALTQWSAIDDHEHVVGLLDWGVEPRPWLATMVTGESLADKERRSADLSLREGIELADAVSHAHRHGVVHAGIDPRNVIYPGDVLESDDRERTPMLDNVGLLSAFRFHFDPSLCLDPRFAAPEYFDDQYGRIDHATDIYQLGAVLYWLFTGRPPYVGAFTEVREGVLSATPTPPSRVVEDLPPAVDDVVSKAMAKQKLTRYETVEHLQQELIGIMEDDTNG